MEFDLLDDDDDDNSQAWMATFADLATLLLTFFVLLLSFANLDVTRFRMALGSVKEALGVSSESPGKFMALSSSPVSLSDKPSSTRIKIIEEMEMLERVRSLIRESGLVNEVEAKLTKRGVAISVKGKLLFATGDAQLSDRGRSTLETIFKIARLVKAPLVIEGHTDPTPIKTRRFPSNWELSTARAIAAMRHLVEATGFERDRVSVAGYADTKPVAANDTKAGRASNRRVEFIFLRPRARRLPGTGKDPPR